MRPETHDPGPNTDRAWRRTRRLVMVAGFLAGMLVMTLAGRVAGLYGGEDRSGSGPAAPAAAPVGRP